MSKKEIALGVLVVAWSAVLADRAASLAAPYVVDYVVDYAASRALREEMERQRHGGCFGHDLSERIRRLDELGREGTP